MPTIDSSRLTPEISDKYTVENNTFLATPKDNPKDLVQLELGDSKTPDKMLAQQKVCRWDNECNVSIRLKDFDNFTVETEGEKIKLVKPEKEVHFYQLGISEEHPEDAQEFEIILNEKPKSNVMEFSVVDKDVDYFYQPALTPEEIEQGADRSENVEGSYAIYAKTPKTNWTGGKEYKVGKVGHIFRPKIIDAKGTEVWGDLHIENGILSVTIPQDFLDKAVYPVRHAAGLTFGYTSAGTGTFAPSSNAPQINGSVYLSGASGGTLTKLTAWFRRAGTTSARVNAGIYNGTTLIGSSATTYTGSDFTIGVDTEKDFTFSSEGISSSTNYTLEIMQELMDSSNAVAFLRDDTGGTSKYQTGVTWGSWPSPATFSSGSRKYSIYATYTASANTKQINIGDTWKNITAVQINIGDTWKAVTSIKINIGDVWKTLFSLILAISDLWKKW